MKVHRYFAVAALIALAAVFALGFASDALAAAAPALKSGALFHPTDLLLASAGAAAASPEEVKAAIERLHAGFEEFKKTNDERLKSVEKKGAADVLVEEKLGRIEKDLAKLEDVNQAIARQDAALKKAEADAKELKDQLTEVEKKWNRPGASGDVARKAEMKAYHTAWLRGAFNGLAGGRITDDQGKAIDKSNAEAKALSIANDTTGGYLAPGEYVRDIIKGVTEQSPVRSMVRVRQTASKSIMLPKRTGQFAAVWVAEQGSRTETDGLRWGLEEIHTHEMYALIDISHQNLEDSAFDLEAEVRMEAEEQFAVAEGTAVVNGNGVGKPEGWLNNAGATGGIGATVSGSAAAITADGLINVYHALKTAYARNGTWSLNRTTLGSVRKLKDSQNQYLWQPGLAGLRPSTILDAPYVEVPDMPNEAANAFPVVFGDFRRGYTMVDRIAMSMLRDPFTQAGSGNIRFLFYRRVGGQLVLTEALRALKCST